jgi:hypothetical protein
MSLRPSVSKMPVMPHMVQFRSVLPVVCRSPHRAAVLPAGRPLLPGGTPFGAGLPVDIPVVMAATRQSLPCSVIS